MVESAYLLSFEDYKAPSYSTLNLKNVLSTTNVYRAKYNNDKLKFYLGDVRVIKLMIKKGYKIEDEKVLLLGITFKENCPNIRNSRVIDVIQELKEFGCDVDASDYWADAEEVKHEYRLKLSSNVNYDEYKDLKLNNKNQVIFDIKSILDSTDGRL